jgi:acyl-CoA dehydrogenase
MPFMEVIVSAYHLGLADEPPEMQKVTLARTLLGEAEPSLGLFPTRHLFALEEQAQKKYADALARHGR